MLPPNSVIITVAEARINDPRKLAMCRRIGNGVAVRRTAYLQSRWNMIWLGRKMLTTTIKYEFFFLHGSTYQLEFDLLFNYILLVLLTYINRKFFYACYCRNMHRVWQAECTAYPMKFDISSTGHTAIAHQRIEY